MPSLGQQLIAASKAGRLDDMQTLVAAGANVEESDTVSWKMAQGCQFRNDACMQAWTWRVERESGCRARWSCKENVLTKILGDGF